MAIIKHIAMKTSHYSGAYNYIVFQHDEFTRKEIVDEDGNRLMREDYWIDGINCDPCSYDYDCWQTNRAFHKNQSYNEIKQHHYIISFDPKDVAECGLTGERAQAIGLDYAKRNFPGHQVIVGTHLDGHNGSGNIHVHIMMNSVRKLDVDEKPFMERSCDHKAGYKHHVTKQFLAYLKSDLMEICKREHLHQVDLLRPAKDRVSDREYYARKRAQDRNSRLARQKKPSSFAQASRNFAQADNDAASSKAPSTFETQKDFLRQAISDCAASAINEKTFSDLLKEKYKITLKVSRGRYGYIHPDRDKPIRGRKLGSDYEETYLKEIFEKNRKPNDLDIPPILTARSDLQLVNSMQTKIKGYLYEPSVSAIAGNQAYSRKVRLSNLKQMAETVAYAQEHGFDNFSSMDKAYDDSLKTLRITRAALEGTNQKLTKVNEQIHYTGQYLSNKKTYAEYRKSRHKAAFRQENYDAIVAYETARDFLKDISNGEPLPTLKALKEQKNQLVAKRSALYNQLNEKRESYRTIKAVRDNICAILSMPDYKDFENSRKQREATTDMQKRSARKRSEPVR